MGMKDPESLQKMGNLLGQGPNKIAQMSKVMQENPDLMAHLQDKEKREELMVKVEKDPDTKEMRKDPEIDQLFNRIKAKDYSAMNELMKKPEVFEKLQKIMS